MQKERNRKGLPLCGKTKLYGCRCASSAEQSGFIDLQLSHTSEKPNWLVKLSGKADYNVFESKGRCVGHVRSLSSGLHRFSQRSRFLMLSPTYRYLDFLNGTASLSPSLSLSLFSLSLTHAHTHTHNKVTPEICSSSHTQQHHLASLMIFPV